MYCATIFSIAYKSLRLINKCVRAFAFTHRTYCITKPHKLHFWFSNSNIILLMCATRRCSLFYMIAWFLAHNKFSVATNNSRYGTAHRHKETKCALRIIRTKERVHDTQKLIDVMTKKCLLFLALFWLRERQICMFYIYTNKRRRRSHIYWKPKWGNFVKCIAICWMLAGWLWVVCGGWRAPYGAVLYGCAMFKMVRWDICGRHRGTLLRIFFFIVKTVVTEKNVKMLTQSKSVIRLIFFISKNKYYFVYDLSDMRNKGGYSPDFEVKYWKLIHSAIFFR